MTGFPARIERFSRAATIAITAIAASIPVNKTAAVLLERIGFAPYQASCDGRNRTAGFNYDSK